MNDYLNVYTINFNQNDIGPLLSTKMTVRDMTIIDLSLEELFKVYPEYKNKTILSRNKF